jgi:hypothetical protein
MMTTLLGMEFCYRCVIVNQLGPHVSKDENPLPWSRKDDDVESTGPYGGVTQKPRLTRWCVDATRVSHFAVPPRTIRQRKRTHSPMARPRTTFEEQQRTNPMNNTDKNPVAALSKDASPSNNSSSSSNGSNSKQQHSLENPPELGSQSYEDQDGRHHPIPEFL